MQVEFIGWVCQNMGQTEHSQAARRAAIGSMANETDMIGPSPEEIRFYLRKILESPAFRGSRRSQRFLDYVSEKLLKGEADDLKERTIAIEVFDRDAAACVGKQSTDEGRQ